MITKEDFDAWRDHPVTEAVFVALRKNAADAKAAWIGASWGAGKLEPELLADLRARAETALDITELTHEELEATLGPEAS